jgi:hypothetical protein
VVVGEMKLRRNRRLETFFPSPSIRQIQVRSQRSASENAWREYHAK